MLRKRIMLAAHRKLLLLGCGCVLLLLLIVFWLPPFGLIANYYDNPEWRGQPMFSKTGTHVNLETLQQAIRYSRFPQTNLSISWHGWIRIAQARTYQFVTRSDDGSSIIIDDTLVVDNGGFHGVQEIAGTIFLTPGMHRFNVNYFNGAGVSALSIYWIDQNGVKTSIPANILFPSRFSKYLALLPRHPLLVYGIYPLLWILLLSVSIGANVFRFMQSHKRALLLAGIGIMLCSLGIYTRYVCDSFEQWRTFLLFSYCFFLSALCFYLIFKVVFPEFIRIALYLFYLFLALFPYKLLFPGSVKLCQTYLDPGTKLLGGIERYWALILYGALSVLITVCWRLWPKRASGRNSSKKELVVCLVLLIVTVVQIVPRLDRNSPRMISDGMHGTSTICDDELAQKWVKNFFGHCVMGDVRHHTDANGMFKGVDVSYSKWVNNRRGLNAYFYALLEPFLHPYYAAIAINGFFFYLILMSGYKLAEYVQLPSPVMWSYPILLSANFLFHWETVDTSFYIAKYAFSLFILIIGYTLQIFSESLSLIKKLLFASVLACCALVYDPYINVAFIFLWGLWHALGYYKVAPKQAYATILHAIVYAVIPIVSQSGFELLLRYYHLEGNLENESARNIIFSKLVLVPGFIVQHFGQFIVRINTELVRLMMSNPLRNEYLSLLGAFGIICFFSLLTRYVQHDKLPGIYALYSACLIVPLLAAVAAYIPPVAKYVDTYTSNYRTSNYYPMMILAQSMGIYYSVAWLCSWLPPSWIKPRYIINSMTYVIVVFIFLFSYHSIL